MNIAAISEQIRKRHLNFTEYLKSLSVEDFNFYPESKWNARQQLQHIILCLDPLMKAFYIPKEALKAKFGVMDRKSLSMDELYELYIVKLKEGGKAPDRFVPDQDSGNDRDQLCDTLNNTVEGLIKGIHNFSEEELDQFAIPHPLLGKISIREMLYNAIHHVQHHEKMTRKNLNIHHEKPINSFKS